jgi:RNA polymerase sigma-70 factor (ECF subfamily)
MRAALGSLKNLSFVAVIGDVKKFMSDTRASLIERVRNQDDSVAWTEFFDIYRPLLVAYVRKRGVSEHDASDVVQDVFSRLVPALGQFEFDAQRGRFRTWLWRVTHNALADWGRRRAVRNRAEQEWAEQERAELNSVVLREQAHEEESDVAWDELYRRRILEVVTERVRATTQPVTWACFEGRILAGRPAAEIATETGISVNAVYVNASRVLSRVREECASFQEPLGST